MSQKLGVLDSIISRTNSFRWACKWLRCNNIDGRLRYIFYVLRETILAAKYVVRTRLQLLVHLDDSLFRQLVKDSFRNCYMNIEQPSTEFGSKDLKKMIPRPDFSPFGIEWATICWPKSILPVYSGSSRHPAAVLCLRKELDHMGIGLLE
jgi:hypothetical protein